MSLRHSSIAPAHPGSILREDVLPALEIGKSEFANLLGISRNHLYSILNERAPITPTMAVKLGKLLGNGGDVWLRLQTSHDFYHAQRQVDVGQIPTLDVA